MQGGPREIDGPTLSFLHWGAVEFLVPENHELQLVELRVEQK